jgi:uncharacterized membrane protein YdjX (TVP38/TMEM64 family)
MLTGKNLIEQIKQLPQFLREHKRMGVLTGLSAAMPAAGGVALIGTVQHVSPWLQANEMFGLIAFVTAMIVLAGLALLPTNILGILSGWVFDFWFGFPAVVVGMCGAAALTFFGARRLSGERLQHLIEQKPKARAVRGALLQESLWQTIIVVSLLRLAPVMPFSMMNLLMSAAGVQLKAFLIGTFIGALPRAAATVYIGSEMSELNFSQPQDIWMILPGILFSILALIVIGYISKRALAKYTETENGSLAAQ